MAYVDTKPYARKQGIALALGINAAGVLAAILTTTIIKDEEVFEPTVVTFPEAEKAPPPPPETQTPPDRLVKLPPITTSGTPAIPLPPIIYPHDPAPLLPQPDLPPIAPLIEPPIAPITPPVLRDAKPDPRFAANLQPEYPESAIRREVSGKVTVRVKIGPDGRVIDVKLISASDEVFVDNTLRQALRKWRFLPATRDGKPEDSWREMTVRFELPD